MFVYMYYELFLAINKTHQVKVFMWVGFSSSSSFHAVFHVSVRD